MKIHQYTYHLLDLKKPKNDFFYDYGSYSVNDFSIHIFYLAFTSFKWSNIAPSVILRTFHILFRFVSYFYYIFFILLSILITLSSIVYTLSSTKADMLLSSEASFIYSGKGIFFFYSFINLWTSEKGTSSISWTGFYKCCWLIFSFISIKILLLSSMIYFN